MRFVIKAILCLGILSVGPPASGATFEEIIREAARRNGFVPAEQTHVSLNPALVPPGATFFKSKALSLNGKIACQSCHLDQFSSADGIPNAVAVGGRGKGMQRVMGRGGIIPRNTLPFWGRGGKGFSVFFWDGKIDFSGTIRVSQFGEAVPSHDPLIVAVHLPVAEIREMLIEDKMVRSNKVESVQAAQKIYAAIISRLQMKETAAINALAKVFSINVRDVSFLHVATSIASFIRDKFRLKETRFHRFVFKGDALRKKELLGAQLFYGKGKCAVCHSGPHLSDFKFHAIPMPQLGFGKNGFGVDYGRFNVTHNPQGLYKFRTLPLFNVDKTPPYSHSGSVATLQEAIVFHFDPLRKLRPSNMKAFDRYEYFKRLVASAESVKLLGYLDAEEVDRLVAFLKTLNFD